MSYYRVCIKVATKDGKTVRGQIIHDDKDVMNAVDQTLKSIREKLDESKIKWVHEYYWPGDHYYCIVQIQDRQEIDTLKEVGLPIIMSVVLEDNHRTIVGLSLDKVFKNKYPTEQENNNGEQTSAS